MIHKSSYQKTFHIPRTEAVVDMYDCQLTIVFTT